MYNIIIVLDTVRECSGMERIINISLGISIVIFSIVVGVLLEILDVIDLW